jgi:hypothetical protein
VSENEAWMPAVFQKAIDKTFPALAKGVLAL